jgi:CMP-N-acetylneuraminic acid synthetase
MIGPPPNQPFSEQIYTYYNEYYAPAAVTQQRRLMRNYLSNNAVIKQSNVNPYTQNPNIQYYFINGKMYIYNKKLDIVNRYIRTGSVWCYNMKTQLGPNETINDYLCKQRLN